MIETDISGRFGGYSESDAMVAALLHADPFGTANSGSEPIVYTGRLLRLLRIDGWYSPDASNLLADIDRAIASCG